MFSMWEHQPKTEVFLGDILQALLSLLSVALGQGKPTRALTSLSVVSTEVLTEHLHASLIPIVDFTWVGLLLSSHTPDIAPEGVLHLSFQVFESALPDTRLSLEI